MRDEVLQRLVDGWVWPDGVEVTWFDEEGALEGVESWQCLHHDLSWCVAYTAFVASADAFTWASVLSDWDDEQECLSPVARWAGHTPESLAEAFDGFAEGIGAKPSAL